MRPATLDRSLRDEQGAVLILVTLFLPVLFFLVALAVDVSNYYEHGRHLQTQADAAAFAGGDDFQACFNGGGQNVIFQSATDYAGAPGYYSDYSSPLPYPWTHNLQVGGTDSVVNVRAFYQSPTYWLEDPNGPSDADLNGYPSPCASPYVFDVKATERDLALFMAVPWLSTIFPPVNAHARVQLFSVESTTPQLPLAVPDVNPHEVGVTFVNERTSTELTGCSSGNPLVQPIPGTSCSFYLTKGDVTNGLTNWGGQATVDVPAGSASNIGVRVGIGSDVQSCAGGQGGNGYVCYAYPDLWTGLELIRGYDPSIAASPTSPQLRAAWPTTNCGWFTPFFSDADASTSCTASVNATVDFGGDPSPSLRATVSPVGAGGNQTAPLTLGGDGIWHSAVGAFSIPVAAGAYDVTLDWKDSNQKNWTSFNGGKAIQRIYGATDDGSGPIKHLAVSTSPYAYSLAAGVHDVSVSLQLKGMLELATPCSIAVAGQGGNYNCPTDRPVLLRFASSSGSQNYAVDCGTVPGHTGGDLYQQILYGCANPYSVNEPGVCPDPANPSPPDCVPIANFVGDKVGQIRSAMNDRFAPGGVCRPNNYPHVDMTDPRVVTLIVTNFDAFTGQGGSGPGVPVVTYAAFYVTGWDGAVSSCTGVNEPVPAGSGNGDVWGHFIKYVNPDAGPSPNPCQSDINLCTPVLTR